MTLKSAMQPILSVVVIFCTGSATAGELIYRAKNPTFGGNPSYSSHLLATANAQNDHDDPDRRDLDDMTSLEEFNDRLQRSIISRITSALSANIVGDDGVINPGTFETTDFVINVEDLGGDQIRITTTDKLTNDETIFEIDSSL